MRGTTITALLAASLVAISNALYLVETRDALPAVIGLSIQRKPVQDAAKRDALRRRQTKTVSETLDNEGTLYFANVSLGTPPQNLRLHIDTGSSDLWTNAKASSLCRMVGDPCSISGTYDSAASSTFKLLSNSFNISYVDGSGAAGDYATDTLSIGGQQLTGLQFGIGIDSSSPEGILGIGYASNEVQVNRNGGKAYPNVPQLMADNGLTKSNAFSLWLDDLAANTGSILFGGVDTDKFHGTLGTLPVQKEYGQFTEFLLTLTGFTLTANGKTQDIATTLPTPVLLDSGSSLTYLPNGLTKDLYTALNLQYDQQQGVAVVDCNLANSADNIAFTFSSPKITVPFSELVIPAGQAPDGSNVCIFGISPADGSTAVLGDTFIRSAYIVYDLSNDEISLAQTNFNATSSNVLEIGTGNNAVPSASVVANAVTAAVSETGGARIGMPTATGTATRGGGGSPTATGKSAGSLVRVSYGIVVGLAGVAVAFTLA